MKKLIATFLFVLTLLAILPQGNFAIAQTYGGASVPYGTTPPATCANIGDLFWDSDDNLLYICDPVDTWVEAGGGGTTVGVDEIFGAGWNGDTGLAEKDDIHDYIHDYLDPDYNGLDDETITPTRIALKLSKLTSSTAPVSPLAGEVYYADESTWDPAGIGIGVAYYVLYDGADWVPLFDEDGNWYINKSQAAGNVITTAIDLNLTAAQMNSTVTVTAASDVNIPDGQCDDASGKWLIVKKIGGTHLVSVSSDDTTPDVLYLSDGTALTSTAGWELDLASANASQVTLQCIVAHQWWVMGEIGTCTDGLTGD